MKSGKRYMTDGMEQTNQDKIRTLGENETYKYLDIWRLTPSSKWKWRTNLKKNISGDLENYLRQNYLAETGSKE